MCDFESNDFVKGGLTKDDIQALSEKNRKGEEYAESSEISEMNVYKIFLYVKQFRPEDICIKVIDRDLIIGAKHDEQLDLHGLVTREFRRTYAIPEEFEPESVSSIFGPQGILKIFILSRELWEEFHDVKASIFRGYINRYLFDLKSNKCATENRRILQGPVACSENVMEEEEALRKIFSVPFNTEVTFRKHTRELRGSYIKQSVLSGAAEETLLSSMENLDLQQPGNAFQSAVKPAGQAKVSSSFSIRSQERPLFTRAKNVNFLNLKK